MTVSMLTTRLSRGDHRLRRERHDLLAQVDVGAHLVDERHQEVDAALERARVAAEPLDDQRCLLGHDAHRAEEHDQRKGNQDQQDDEACSNAVHVYSVF